MLETPPDPSSLPGEEERMLLRESVRGFLAEHWPAAGAVERAQDGAATAALWQGLAAQGLTALGHEASEGGLREAAVVMEELGRAACPVPVLGAVVLNVLVSRMRAAGASTPGVIKALHAGALRPCVAAVNLVDSHQGHAGNLRLSGSGTQCTAEGQLCFVDGAAHATHVLAWEATGLVLIALHAGGAQVLPARALGLPAGSGWCELRLHNAPAERIHLPGPPAVIQSTLLTILRTGWLARAHGAARRAFEMAVDYAKERRQFGQPIGRFQAVQHKLADNLIALEGVRLTLTQAAQAFDGHSPDAPYFAATAYAFGGTALRQVALQTQHAFGAIGYAEEHEAPRHFRRAHLDVLPLGGAAAARAQAAARMLDDGPAKITGAHPTHTALPEYDLGAAGNALRNEVREWLATHWSGERKAAFDHLPFHEREFDASFARDLGHTGWIGLAWPREHGGQARSAREQLALMEVMEAAEAPRTGAAVQANALLMHGTPAQQQRYLPEILRGEAMHGMGYSEPEAGSDLASLRTSAVWEGDNAHGAHANEPGTASHGHWVINGQKIWTSTYWGKYMFLAARTDREAKPAHAGISMFIVPMDSPGISVKPATTMYDGRFANIFYDKVRIPAANLVGPVNGGWKVLTDALANERGLVGGGIVLKVAHAFELLCQDIRADERLRTDPLVRDRIGQLACEIEVGRQLMLHCAELAERSTPPGTTPPEMGAISKVFSGELMERFGEAALDILGPRAALSQGAPGALRCGRFEQNLRHSLMWVISIGTNEIQRSLIAQRGLGLPR
jgi:alkylation response protein AidB-like acyl-CoA dehydrogenase